MKKRTSLAISCFFLAGLGGYIYFTPLISLYQLYQATAQHNKKEIEAGVDFDSLRDDIKPQVRTKVSNGLEESLGGKNFISSGIAGLGMAFLLSQLKPTFFDARSLRSYTGMPMLGTVSMLTDSVTRSRRRQSVLAFSTTSVLYLVLFGSLIAWYTAKTLLVR